MNIIRDESKEQHTVNKCENCGKEKPSRWVKVVGIFSEARGSYMLCFDCFAPQIFWKDERNIVFETPANLFGRNHAALS